MNLTVKHTLLILSFLATFAWFSFPMADADLGWHLKLGEIIRQTGNPRVPNQFSSLMPNYVWPNHSWGYDVILSGLFDIGSFPLLSLTGSFLIALAVLISYLRIRAAPSLFSILLLAYLGSELLYTGLRSQLVSLVFTALLVFLLERFISSKKPSYAYSIPPLFLLWANFHGQFILGLGLLAILTFVTIKSPEKKLTPSQNQKLLLIVFLSLFASLINPFGIELFRTAFEHLNAPTLPFIYEWMPWETNTNRFIVFFGYGLLFLYLMYRNRKAVSKREMALQLVLFAMAVKARRMIPFFLVISMPLFDRLVFEQISNHIKFKTWYVANIVGMASMAMIIALTILPKRNLLNQTWISYCQTEILCSEPLIAFLKNERISGNIFNAYRLGGHLIYRYPQEKVFIDGRMTVWHQNAWYPFQDYFTLVHAGPGYQNLIHQYHLKYFILHPQFELTQILENVFKWPVIYQDKTLKVFRNPNQD